MPSLGSSSALIRLLALRVPNLNDFELKDIS